jgi:hypothetical protein
MDLVLVRNISNDKAYELLETSSHNVQPFKPEIMKKALQYGDGNECVCLFSKQDKQNCLVMAAITPNYGPTNDCYYLHEMVGFQKGYGRTMLQLLCKKLKKLWLQCEPIYDSTSDTYSMNDGLANGVYRKIPELKEYVVNNSIWKCPVNFFYYGIPDNEIAKFLEEQYGS